jgi:carbon catabolite-derepressing protein kinase
MHKQGILAAAARPDSRTLPTMTATMRVQEPTTVMCASKLGEYTVVQEIAEGTFGKVKSMYRISSIARLVVMILLPVAVHTLTGHKVAMKFISKHVINMTRTKNRVQREVEYMRTLRHPHIIKLSVSLSIAFFHI